MQKSDNPSTTKIIKFRSYHPNSQASKGNRLVIDTNIDNIWWVKSFFFCQANISDRRSTSTSLFFSSPQLNTIVNQNEIVNEVNTEVVNNVVNDITSNNVNIAEAAADSSSASIASSEAEADTYAESHPTEKARPKESASTDSPAEESTDEQGQAAEEIPTVEPCDAAATYLAGIRYHEKKQAADARMKLVTIEKYVRFIMSLYIEDKYMDDLWKELRAFAENPKCEPISKTIIS